ncbi:MAG: hypothetical protein ACLUUO_19890 [Sellimonas intestinalis]
MEAREIIRKDMEALYLGNLNTVEFQSEPAEKREIRIRDPLDFRA